MDRTLFPRQLFGRSVEGNEGDFRRRRSMGWYANGRRTNNVIIDDEVDTYSRNRLSNRGEQKVLEPHARVKQIRLMTRQNQRNVCRRDWTALECSDPFPCGCAKTRGESGATIEFSRSFAVLPN